ncbi:MAG: asparagine synthase-related protein [Niveispirillum sp.]|uniref:asparagine synthase-related protein n=1 Tax=Niveispirillum sp. TaxID=1917217 RepID=UPI003BA48B22
MRLICGLLRLDGEMAQPATLDAMATAMMHPGLHPAIDRRLDGPLGLAVLDFTGAGGSLFERDGWILAADARLDRPGPDGAEAAILAAAHDHGADFPDRIDGDFAVALWRRGSGELLLGRDFIGVRPLAWTWRPGGWFAFASLPKGLHGSGLADPGIDPVAVGSQFSQIYFTGADSGFTDIAYLQAGHSLRVRAGDAAPPRPHRAYRPDPAAVGRWRGTLEQAAGTLRHLLEQAVSTRLPASGPVACHLSGGLDSSAVTVLAARAMRRGGGRVLALSMTTPTAAGPADRDERPLIAAVLAQEPDVGHALVHDLLPLPGLAQDPDWPGAVIGGHDDRMAAAAAAFGADRILSGVGGDEGATYNGANLYARLLREGHLRTLLRELPIRARMDGLSLPRTIYHRLVWPLLPDYLRSRIGRWRGHPKPMDPHHGIARYLNPVIRDKVMRRRMPIVLQENSPVERVRAFADHHIPMRCAYYAIMAARHGMAVSFPLLDRRVVDFMLSLPVHLFLADGQSRQPFRRAMRGILPDPVRLATSKVGLSDDWFIRYADRKAELLAALETLRMAPHPLVTEIFDLDAIAAGLDLLPEPEAAAGYVRTRAGPSVGGGPVWLSFMAAHALATAWQFSRIPDRRGA